MSHCDFKAQLKSSLKAVGRHHYIHLDGFDLLPADATARLDAAESLAQITRGDRCNVARFDNSHDRVALLNYPSFFEDAFPALHESWNVDLTPGRVSYRNYRDSLTPPILHRKELMLPEDHPRRAEFQALTETAEAIGLFEDSTRIGFREQWLRLVREKGYQIVGHDLIPIANDEATDVTTGAPTNGGAVARHLTALVSNLICRLVRETETFRL
jgi:DNA phosphorothioation-associated putative methyltransferase